MSGAMPLSYGEIKEYCLVSGQMLSRKDIDTLLTIDRVFLENS